MCDTFTDEEGSIAIQHYLLQLERMKGVVKELAKGFWKEVSVKMGKSAAGCERAAKEANIQVTL